MKAFIEENEKGDYLIHSPDKKINPWMEKVKSFGQIPEVNDSSTQQCPMKKYFCLN